MKFLSLALLLSAVTAQAGSFECKSIGQYANLQNSGDRGISRVEFASYADDGFSDQFTATCTSTAKDTAAQSCDGLSDGSRANVQVMISGQDVVVYAIEQTNENSSRSLVLFFKAADCTTTR